MSTYSFTGFRIQYDIAGNPVAFLGASTLSLAYNSGTTPTFSYSVLTPPTATDLPVVDITADNSVDVIVDGNSIVTQPIFDDLADEVLFGEITWDDNGTPRTTLIMVLYDNETSTDYIYVLGGQALPTVASLLDFTNFLSNDLTGAQIAASPFGPGDSMDFSTLPFAVLDENDVMNGTSIADTIDAGIGNDLVNANGGNDFVNGGADNDTIYGSWGSDTLVGSTGDDSIFGGTWGDLLGGEGGNDHVAGEDGSDRLYGGWGTDTILGGAGNDSIYAGNWGDIVDGGGDSDLIYGQNGHDLLTGDWGSDTLLGGNGDDSLYGGTWGDLMGGDAGNDLLDGEDGNDRLYGGVGNDTIIGGAGNDRIFGGDDTDSLTGGAGSDVFVFATAAEAGIGLGVRDVITDFASTIGNFDQVDLTGMGISGTEYIFGSAFSGSMSPEVRTVLINGGADTLVQGDVNGDGTADFELLLLGFATPGNTMFV